MSAGGLVPLHPRGEAPQRPRTARIKVRFAPKATEVLRCRENEQLRYSITSSARIRNESGMVNPSALAVVRLTTRSNLVGCSTGISLGLVPRRILSTMSAARRKWSRMNWRRIDALGRERSRGAKPYRPEAHGRAPARSFLTPRADGIVEASRRKGRRRAAKQGRRRALVRALRLCTRLLLLWHLGYGFSCRPP